MHQHISCCDEVVQAQRDIQGLDFRVGQLETESRAVQDNLKDAVKELTGEIAELRKQLVAHVPPWVTPLVSVLVCIIGVLAGAIGTLLSHR
jgi:hypothetical protein